MKRFHQHLISTGIALTAATVASTTTLAQTPFTANDIVVERIGGTGAFGGAAAAPAATATAVFVDEFRPTTAAQATPVQTISLPAAATQPVPSGTTPNATQLNFTDNGSAGASGFLNRSADGTTLVVSGYNAVVGATIIGSGSNATTNQRVVGLISAAAGVDTTTYSTAAYTTTAGAFRSVVSVNGTGNYYGAGVGGTTSGGTVLFSNKGGSTSTLIGSSVVTNTRVNEIFTIGGTQSLFYSTGAGTAGIYTYSGLPTTVGAASTLLVADPSPYGFSISPDGLTIYIADDATGGGIRKYTSTTGAAGSFTLANTFATISRGLTVDFSNPNLPVLFATTVGTAAGNSLITLTDTGDLSLITATTLATSPTNTFFRGVDFAPVAVPEPTTYAMVGGGLGLLLLGQRTRRRSRGLRA